MRIKLLKPYNMFCKGETPDLSRPIAELLIQRKIAEPLEVKKRGRPKLETKIIKPEEPQPIADVRYD